MPYVSDEREITVLNVIEVAEKVLERFLKLPENIWPDKNGGYLTLQRISTGKRYFVAEIGNSNPVTAEACFDFCQEKTNRTRHYAKHQGHFSSWQSRDFDQKKYGGAITAPSDSLGYPEGRDLLTGFSGLKEPADEAVCLVTDCIFRWLVISDAMRIVQISQNHLFQPLVEACSDLFDNYPPPRQITSEG